MIHYIIYDTTNPINNSENSDVVEIVVNDLRAGTSYNVRARMVNSAGEGVWSDYVKLTTRRVPGPPEYIHFDENFFYGKYILKWCRPDDFPGIVHDYIVGQRKGKNLPYVHGTIVPAQCVNQVRFEFLRTPNEPYRVVPVQFVPYPVKFRTFDNPDMVVPNPRYVPDPVTFRIFGDPDVDYLYSVRARNRFGEEGSWGEWVKVPSKESGSSSGSSSGSEFMSPQDPRFNTPTMSSDSDEFD